MMHRTRINVMVEQHTVDLLNAVKARTGLSLSEQVRRALRSWPATRQRSRTAARRDPSPPPDRLPPARTYESPQKS